MESVSVEKIDVEKLSEKELEKAQLKISNKLNKIIKKANEDANKFLDIYGMETEIVLEIRKKQN